MVQVFEPLPLTWETWVDYLTPGPDLGSEVIGGVNQQKVSHYL